MPERRAARILALIVPPILIALIALGYFLGSQFAAAEFPPNPPLVLVLAVLAAQTALLAARVRFPWPALLAIAAGHVWLLIASHGELSVGAIAVMFAVYHVAIARPGRLTLASVIAVAAVLIVVSAVALRGSIQVPVEWQLILAVAQALLAVAVPYIVAELVLSRRRLVAALQERAELAEQARERDAAAAAERERTQIARELHDIAAHHLTSIILSTQAARAVAATDPAAARAHSETAANEARLALEGIRATVGLLREKSDAERAPLPGYTDISQLIEAMREQGTKVTLSGLPSMELGAAASLAAFRMTQESLANARVHAPGAACDVQIEADATELRITVTNSAVRATASAPLASAGQGLGLVGMRERAALLGGSFASGRTADGGWRNLLRLPLTQEGLSE